jgi:hypothetical protein
MLRIALVLALGFAAVTLAGLNNSASAQDKKEEKKTLEGKLVCTKCELSETKTCGHALLVKDGDKKITYYISDKGGKEPYHKDCCTAPVDAKVTGKLGEKDGKKTIEEPKVEIKK